MIFNRFVTVLFINMIIIEHVLQVQKIDVKESLKQFEETEKTLDHESRKEKIYFSKSKLDCHFSVSSKSI